jgi:hypothetical protein
MDWRTSCDPGNQIHHYSLEHQQQQQHHQHQGLLPHQAMQDDHPQDCSVNEPYGPHQTSYITGNLLNNLIFKFSLFFNNNNILKLFIILCKIVQLPSF